MNRSSRAGLFLAAGAAGLAVLSMLPTGEELRPRLQPSWEGVTRLAARPAVLLASLLAAIGQFANRTTTLEFTPILTGRLGGSDVTQSILVSVNLLILMIGGLCATPLIRRPVPGYRPRGQLSRPRPLRCRGCSQANF